MHSSQFFQGEVIVSTKSHSCQICGQLFLTIDELKEHVRNPCRNQEPGDYKRSVIIESDRRRRTPNHQDYQYPYTPGQPVFPSSSITRNVYNNTQKALNSVISPEEAAVLASSKSTNAEPVADIVVLDNTEQFTPEQKCKSLVSLLHGELKSIGDYKNSLDEQEVIIDNYAAENTIRNGGLTYSDDPITDSTNEISTNTDPHDDDDLNNLYDSDSDCSESSAKKQRLSDKRYSKTQLILGLTQINVFDMSSDVKFINREPFVINLTDADAYLANEVMYLDDASGDMNDNGISDTLLTTINGGSIHERKEFLCELGEAAFKLFRQGAEDFVGADTLDKKSQESEISTGKLPSHPLDILAASAVERSKMEKAQRESPKIKPPKVSPRFAAICRNILLVFESRVDNARDYYVTSGGGEDIISHFVNQIDFLRKRVNDLWMYFDIKSSTTKELCLLIMARFVMFVIRSDVSDVSYLFKNVLLDLPNLQETDVIIQPGIYPIPQVKSKSVVHRPTTRVINANQSYNHFANTSYISEHSSKPSVKIANINLSQRTVSVPQDKNIVTPSLKDLNQSNTEVNKPIMDEDLIKLLVSQQQAAYQGNPDYSITHQKSAAHTIQAQGQTGPNVTTKPEVPMTQYITEAGQVLYIEDLVAGKNVVNVVNSVDLKDLQNVQIIGSEIVQNLPVQTIQNSDGTAAEILCNINNIGIESGDAVSNPTSGDDQMLQHLPEYKTVHLSDLQNAQIIHNIPIPQNSTHIQNVTTETEELNATSNNSNYQKVKTVQLSNMKGVQIVPNIHNIQNVQKLNMQNVQNINNMQNVQNINNIQNVQNVQNINIPNIQTVLDNQNVEDISAIAQSTDTSTGNLPDMRTLTGDDIVEITDPDMLAMVNSGQITYVDDNGDQVMLVACDQSVNADGSMTYGFNDNGVQYYFDK